jgi:hypothetical protein
MPPDGSRPEEAPSQAGREILPGSIRERALHTIRGCTHRLTRRTARRITGRPAGTDTQGSSWTSAVSSPPASLVLMTVPGPPQDGSMLARVTVAAVICLAVAGVSGCTQPTRTCSVTDYSGGGTSGYQTPRQALQSALTQHEPPLPETGWTLTGRGADAATFASGNDSIDLVRNKAGKWNVGGATVCTLHNRVTSPQREVHPPY